MPFHSLSLPRSTAFTSWLGCERRNERHERREGTVGSHLSLSFLWHVDSDPITQIVTFLPVCRWDTTLGLFLHVPPSLGYVVTHQEAREGAWDVTFIANHSQWIEAGDRGWGKIEWMRADLMVSASHFPKEDSKCFIYSFSYHTHDSDPRCGSEIVCDKDVSVLSFFLSFPIIPVPHCGIN